MTLHRLLDGEVTSGLLLTVVEQDRVSRFGWTLDSAAARLVRARFEYQAYQKRYPLADHPEGLVQAIQLAMAHWGTLCHQGLETEIAVRGVCAQCVQH